MVLSTSQPPALPRPRLRLRNADTSSGTRSSSLHAGGRQLADQCPLVAARCSNRYLSRAGSVLLL